MILLRIQTQNIDAMLYSSISGLLSFGVHTLDDRRYIQSVLCIYQAYELLLLLGQPRTAYALRNQMCICWQRILFVFLVIFQFSCWLLTTKRKDGYGVRAYEVAALENVAPWPLGCGPNRIQRKVYLVNYLSHTKYSGSRTQSTARRCNCQNDWSLLWIKI